jgi:hypothetical protein
VFELTVGYETARGFEEEVSMSGHRTSQQTKRVGNTPDPDQVARRAEGRPPEESSSEEPSAQAEAILEDSEDRIEGGADKSKDG